MNAPSMRMTSPQMGPDRIHISTGSLGTVAARHADETTYASYQGDEPWLGMCLALQTPRGPLALYVSLTPDEARQHAAELTRIADKLDQGKGKQ